MNLREVLNEQIDMKKIDQELKNFEQGSIPRSQFVADVRQTLQSAQQEILQTKQEAENQEKIIAQLRSQMKQNTVDQRQGIGSNRPVGSRRATQRTSAR